MTIVFGGPPQSGKSVLIANLRKRLPDDCARVIRACPDGEGDWSNESGNFNADVRIKGAFTPEFVERKCCAIKNNRNQKIVIVDVGGIISEENEKFFKLCDGYVTLCRSEEETEEWSNFADSIINYKGKNLFRLGRIFSDLYGHESIEDSGVETNTIIGTLAGLDRKAFLRESPLLDRIAARIIKKSGYSIDDSRHLELHNLSGLALAHNIGCQKTEIIEDVEIPKAFWSYDSIDKVYDVLTELVNESDGKVKEVNIDAVRPAFVLCACTKALLNSGMETITTMDLENNLFVPIRRIEKIDGIAEADGLDYHVIEAEKGIFFDVDIKGQNYSLEEYANCVLPKLNTNKPLFISGRVPNWLMASIATSYDSPSVSVLQPPKGFICTYSKNKKELGTLKESIHGIDLDKYFADKKEAIKTGKIFEFSNKNYLTDEKRQDAEI